jgi:protein-L-isoaspartate O-methyltransferase
VTQAKNQARLGRARATPIEVRLSKTVEEIMDDRLHFPATAAFGYDDHVGQYTGKLVPRLLEIARLEPGQTVLEVAAGTGIAASAVADLVGKSATGFSHF